MTRCMGCMAEILEEEEICPYCGYQKGTAVKEAYYLLPETVLGEKYIIGRVLGYGGFGVTYIGWDMALQRKVAVKEYLPSDFATRSYGTQMLTVFSGEAAEQFQAGLDSFVFEAKRLARFNSIPEIVDIYDCFMENDTGYIIMEFLEGITVKEMLKEQERVPEDEARRIVMSVLRGLSAVHKEGIIHRDIAPDNIFITKDGEVRILDFGAARYAAAVQSRSLSVILKPGYAPEEQYRSRGEQGPWTDIYALGATYYRMITGVRPEESIERMAEDHIQTPSQLGIAIAPNIENAIMNSLNVRKEYRIQDAESFYQALESEGGADTARIVEVKERREELRFPLWLKCAAGAAGVLVLICIILFAAGNISFTRKQIESGAGALALGEDECYVPNVLGMSYEEAEKILQAGSLGVVINGINYSDSIERNRILSQQPKDGTKTAPEETVYVVMSGGREEVMMQDLTGMEYEAAVELLAAQKLVLTDDETAWEYSDFIEKGRVMAQSAAAGERIGVLTKIKLTVSLGSLSKETAVLAVPDLSGMTMEKALERLAKLKDKKGFTFSIGEVVEKHNAKVKKGRIISQTPQAGSKVRTNEPIALVISKGPEMASVPDLIYTKKEEAVRVLKDAGFKVKVEKAYSGKVSKGLVISQDKKAGKETAKGSTVTITVSLGKEPVKQDTGKDPQTSQGSSNSSQGTSNRIQTPPQSNPPQNNNNNSNNRNSSTNRDNRQAAPVEEREAAPVEEREAAPVD